MEGLQKAFKSAISSQQPKLPSISSSSSNNTTSSAAFTSDPPQLFLSRTPRRVVSLWTCSKACAFCFLAGIVVGYTLKRRVRRWAAKLLRRLKDD